MDDFTRGYLECALWTSDADIADEAPTDRDFSIDDFSPASLVRAKAEGEAFQAENAADLEGFPKSPDGNSAEAFAGHNFWLTRNGHGSGFWDRGLGEAGDRLSEAARKVGERYVYVGDDGQLWIG